MGSHDEGASSRDYFFNALFSDDGVDGDHTFASMSPFSRTAWLRLFPLCRL